MTDTQRLEPISVSLPSLVRKFGSVADLKDKFLDFDCRLSRIRRSRNWKLTAKREQLLIVLAAFESSNEAQIVWVLKQVRSALAELTKVEQSHLESLREYFAQHHHSSETEMSQQQAIMLRLKALLKQQPNLSVSQVMQHGQCTRIQAIHALDAAEGLD
ncbi:hypothetical protein DBZ36_05450 [Alginatibacterium sediminis]|uniref:Ribosome recycling factor n=1 Tax=Alginatibacterium sediminis TaxID=2164068 RepID=A0A420EGR6_9ALTE|nr:ribosome recycling factor family protein [Alginatibacterium sediminis]RKF19905.1 hypothetical protein DBZ36_05450 [Alginatibacterium sediminis]